MSRLSDIATRWLASPRILRLLNEEAVVRALIAVVRLPTAIGSLREQCIAALARALGLATSDQTVRLERALERLEQDVGRLKSRLAHR